MNDFIVYKYLLVAMYLLRRVCSYTLTSDVQQENWFSRMSRRHRVGRAPPERPLNSACVMALERTLREFPARLNGDVIVPEVGVTFDSIGEAYDFYNLVVFMGTGVRSKIWLEPSQR